MNLSRVFIVKINDLRSGTKTLSVYLSFSQVPKHICENRPVSGKALLRLGRACRRNIFVLK